jgi:glucuronate isomerase
MFTSEPPLSQRIERLIEATPLVDPHTHLHALRPAAPDLAALMSYHWLQTELRAVGMPAADLDPALPPDERVRRALPFLARMRNTAMAWCFRRILRDLYDLTDPDLDPSNLSAILDRVAATGADPAWPAAVLRDRCNIRTIVTSLGNAGPDPAATAFGHRVAVRYMLDVHYLLCPGVATDLTPFFPGRTTKAEYADALSALFDGERIGTADLLERRLRDWLDRTVSGPCRFSNTFIPIETRFTPPDRTAAERALHRAALGNPIDDTEIDDVVRLVTDTVLAWHHDHRKAFQIAVGAEYFICDGKSIPRFDPSWTSEMARAFHRFGHARFDLMMASAPMLQDVCVLARQFPNVHTSGYWWHSFFPTLIEQTISLRLQVAPMTKIGGFLCDAYYAEWTYGKLQVVKKAMAAALAHLVESRFLEENELPDLLRQILHDSPRDLYDLAD